MRKIASSGKTERRSGSTPGRGEITAERLLDDDPRVEGKARGAESLVTVANSAGGIAR